MGIVLTFFGSFLLYAKSRHFPGHLRGIGDRFKNKVLLARLLAYVLFVIAIALLVLQLGFFTGLLVFFITLMFALSLTILLLPLHKKYAYVLAALS